MITPLSLCIVQYLSIPAALHHSGEESPFPDITQFIVISPAHAAYEVLFGSPSPASVGSKSPLIASPKLDGGNEGQGTPYRVCSFVLAFTAGVSPAVTVIFYSFPSRL